jgi:acyl-CoA synthetase (NDP forming)
MLSVEESLELLKKHKLPVADFKVVSSESAAVAAARDFGFPVVMKIISEKHSHKTDVGGVLTHLCDADDVKGAFRKLSRLSKEIMVQKHIDGIETIVGLKHDPTFGCVVLFGLGGIFVEAVRDVSFRVCPISKKDASEMIREIKGSKVLLGFRGKKCDLEALKDMIISVSHLASKEKIKEMDLNPVIVNSRNAWIADARIELQ